MSKEDFLVCQGAMCQCKMGVNPDTLKVLSQQKYYINDNSGADKLVGNTMDLGIPFEIGTFGNCSVTNSACAPTIVQWEGFYEKVELGNGGQVLTDKSKGICAVTGSPVIEFITNGQIGAPQASNFEEENENVQNQLNPLVNLSEIVKKGPFEGVDIKSI